MSSQPIQAGQLLGFLDEMLKTGRMNPQTAASKRKAVSAILDVVGEDQWADVTKIDLVKATILFGAGRGKDLKEISLQTYRQRFENAIKDFENHRINTRSTESYLKRNALSLSEYLPNVSEHIKPNALSPSASLSSLNERTPASDTTGLERYRLANIPNSLHEIVFPIPIRPSVTVRVVGIPSDLTFAEAQKISKVILALATDNDV